MSPREKIRHAAATAKAEIRKLSQANCSMETRKMQPKPSRSYYTPYPGLVAYVAYADRIRRFEIIVSPVSYNDRGIWFEDKLPGSYDTADEAQTMLDLLADTEGWRFCAMPS